MSTHPRGPQVSLAERTRVSSVVCTKVNITTISVTVSGRSWCRCYGLTLISHPEKAFDVNSFDMALGQLNKRTRVVGICSKVNIFEWKWRIGEFTLELLQSDSILHSDPLNSTHPRRLRFSLRSELERLALPQRWMSLSTCQRLGASCGSCCNLTLFIHH